MKTDMDTYNKLATLGCLWWRFAGNQGDVATSLLSVGYLETISSLLATGDGCLCASIILLELNVALSDKMSMLFSISVNDVFSLETTFSSPLPRCVETMMGAKEGSGTWSNKIKEWSIGFLDTTSFETPVLVAELEAEVVLDAPKIVICEDNVDASTVCLVSTPSFSAPLLSLGAGVKWKVSQMVLEWYWYYGYYVWWYLLHW
jgi:hypothetical protein